MANHGGTHASEYPGFLKPVPSALARPANPTKSRDMPHSLTRMGIHPLPRSGSSVSHEHIDELRDQEGV